MITAVYPVLFFLTTSLCIFNKYCLMMSTAVSTSATLPRQLRDSFEQGCPRAPLSAPIDKLLCSPLSRQPQ